MNQNRLGTLSRWRWLWRREVGPTRYVGNTADSAAG